MAEFKEKKGPKLTFSGHDTFHCRHLWLKKGYDFIEKGRKFSDEDSVISLGVGKNMVSAIQFWMRAFGLVDSKGELTPIAHYIFAANGKDPYLEDTATLWLLHYQLVKRNIASTYHFIFNELRKEKVEFTKENFLNFVERRAIELGYTQFNGKTVGMDFEVFIKMYLRTADQSKDKEDTFSGLLTDLNLVNEEKRKLEKGSVIYYSISNENRSDIPEEIVLYTILDQKGIQKSVSLNSVFQDRDQAGSTFAINRNSIMDKIENLTQNTRLKQFGITISDHAGIKELQFAALPDKFTVLDAYYGE
jgi:hypothetical protein